MNILIYETYSTNKMLIKKIFEILQFKYTISDDKSDVLAIAKNYDAVIFDIDDSLKFNKNKDNINQVYQNLSKNITVPLIPISIDNKLDELVDFKIYNKMNIYSLEKISKILNKYIK